MVMPVTALLIGTALIALAPLAGAAIAWARLPVEAPRELGLDEHLLELAERSTR